MLSDIDIRQKLVERIDVQRQSVAIAVGVMEPDRRSVITPSFLKLSLVGEFTWKYIL